MIFIRSSGAFSVIELIFVIVVLGILSAFALPRFADAKEHADIAKGRSDIVAIRTGIINERQSRVIRGDFSWIKNGVEEGQMDNKGLFGAIFTHPITNSNSAGNWSATAGSGVYYYKVSDKTSLRFDYKEDSGRFECDTKDSLCTLLLN